MRLVEILNAMRSVVFERHVRIFRTDVIANAFDIPRRKGWPRHALEIRHSYRRPWLQGTEDTINVFIRLQIAKLIRTILRIINEPPDHVRVFSAIMGVRCTQKTIDGAFPDCSGDLIAANSLHSAFEVSDFEVVALSIG